LREQRKKGHASLLDARGQLFDAYVREFLAKKSQHLLPTGFRASATGSQRVAHVKERDRDILDLGKGKRNPKSLQPDCKEKSKKKGGGL